MCRNLDIDKYVFNIIKKKLLSHFVFHDLEMSNTGVAIISKQYYFGFPYVRETFKKIMCIE